MTERDPQVDREGIYIDRSLAEEIAIEEELDSSVVGPYRFPSPQRRRLAGHVMLVFAAIALLSIEGGWPVAMAIGLLAIWLYLSAWPLHVDEHRALRVAGSAVEFPVGHASASVRFKGWRSRPRWAVVLYSATEPPDRRALVVVDAVTGEIAEEPYTEELTQP